MLARLLLPRLSVLASLTLVPARVDPSGKLVLVNAQWDRVRVEVRVGPSESCSQNESAGTRTLERDRRWTVVSDRVICWRREQSPGDPSGGWTAWESARLATDEVRNVTI